ncbi:hypothetical protein BS50DRAFT_532747 [Corynespora cassiicola Philippines]|uniref:Uncharacterized protein n=1 Tax=Corynespora cassiicola Philippines TaxID=1448308 RepID=A0A2T2N971_CORCC|nr:hypothetical protein BS50DRAFT_532747 [Corynespora cassiicola Philippines]
MGKRQRPLIDNVCLGEDSPKVHPPIKKRRPLLLYEEDKVPWTPPRSRVMSELLSFILKHEEAFQTRGRLTSLYSDFSHQLETNPESFYANLHVWKKAFADAARGGAVVTQGNTRDLLSVRSGEELARALHHKEHGVPVCLSAVFRDAIKKGEMVDAGHFLRSEASIYHSSWIPSVGDVARWAAQWGLKKLGVVHEPQFGDKLGVATFVIVKNVEAAADKLLQNAPVQNSNVDRVLSKVDFVRRYSNILNDVYPLTDSDFEVLLTHLERDKQAISYDGDIIKFKSENESAPTSITKEDIAVVQLRDTLYRIKEQVPALDRKIAEADREVHEALRTKQMSRAKSALRSKKLAESFLSQRTETALELEGVFIKLQQAVDQVEIVAAMQAGAAAMKGLHEKVGGAEGVQGVVDALNEQMATTEEISGIINESNQQVDESEIEDELEALEHAEKEKADQEEAAKTAARIARLEEAEKDLREKEEGKSDLDINRASAKLSQLSVNHEEEEEEGEKEDKRKELVPA